MDSPQSSVQTCQCDQKVFRIIAQVSKYYFPGLKLGYFRIVFSVPVCLSRMLIWLIICKIKKVFTITETGYVLGGETLYKIINSS